MSVIIKSYNHVQFVAQSIQSILDQSLQDFEIVVTDDASSDGTPDVVRSFTDPRISLQVFPKNRGLSAAMNATLARARGELIAILNSDDYALPGRLERQVAFLDANPDIGAVFTMPMVVDENGAPAAGYFDFRQALELPDFSRRSWLRQFYFSANVLCAPSAMIRRATYASCGEYDLRLTNLQDLDMWVRLAARAPIHVMRDELTAFRVRDNNQNLSAPRPDTILRSQFEFAQILKRFRTLPLEVLEETFAQDLAERTIDASTTHHIWLAELALTVPSPAHHLFALETLFEAAQSDEDIVRFRDRVGAVDVFGTRRAGERDAQVGELHAALVAANARIAATEAHLAAAEAQLVERDMRIGDHHAALAAANAKIAATGEHVVEQNVRIGELYAALVTANAKVAATEAQVAERDLRAGDYHAALVAAKAALTATQAHVIERNERIGELDATLAAAHRNLATTEAQIGELDRKARELGVSLQRLINSRSWRLTAPFRNLLTALKRG